MASVQQQNRVEENKAVIENNLVNNIKRVSNDGNKIIYGNKIIIVGYSPTSGGHTARTLNVVEHALKQGSLSVGSQIYVQVP